MTTVKVIKCQLFIRVIYEGVTLVSSVILLPWLFGPSQLICARSAAFVNETRQRAQKGDVVASQQGFRLRLYLTCFSICADEGLTLETPVSWVSIRTRSPPSSF